MVQLLAKRVTDIIIKFSLNQKERENTAIIFYVCETDKDNGSEFCNQMYFLNLDTVDVPKILMARLGPKKSDHQRTLKMFFQES